MADYQDAFDELGKISAKPEEMTLDQRLKVVEITALLSISQELSTIHHHGINPEYDSSM